MNTINKSPGRTAQITAFLAFFLAFALLSGCYESSVPLAPRETAVLDSALFGSWIVMGQEDEAAPTHMRIQPYDAHSYQVTFCCADFLESHTEADLLRVHLVRVDTVTFANVQELNTDDAPYLFFRYALAEDGVLNLTPVAACLFVDTPLSTSEALYAFVRTHLGHERLYLDEALRFRKVPN